MMDKVNGFGMYRSLTEAVYQKKMDQSQAKKTEKEEKTSNLQQPELSDKAKALLAELQGRYQDTDFMVADYSSEEEAQQYLSRGTKQYSVLIEPELLEKMANDEDEKTKYLGIIDESKQKMEDIKEALGEDAENLKNIGVSIKDNGQVTYFAGLEKMAEKQKERLEQNKEEKEADKTEADKTGAGKTEAGKNEAAKGKDGRLGAVKKAFVEADSVEGLIEKIRKVDWDQIRETKLMMQPMEGSRLDLSV